MRLVGKSEEDIYVIIDDENCVETYSRSLFTALHKYSLMCDISDEDVLEELNSGHIRFELMTIGEFRALPELF